jgi:hypothetical protein
MKRGLFAALVAVGLSLMATALWAQSDYLIWDRDLNHNSANIIQNALNAAGYAGVRDTNITSYLTHLQDYCSIWICVGIFPDADYPWTPVRNDSLRSYLINHHGKMYLEGGNVWAFDPVFTLRNLFNISGDANGAADLATINGVNARFTQGMSFVYGGDNAFIDHISPLSTAFTIFNNSSPAYGCGVAYNDGVGSYKTVGVSFEFGGLTDGADPSTKAALADSIMSFFGCKGAAPNYDLATVEIVNPTWYAVPNLATPPQVKFKNNGLNAADAINVYVTITGGYSSTRVISVPVGGEVTETFDNWTPGSPCNNYTLKAYLVWGSDQKHGNDTLTTSVKSWDGRWNMYSAWTTSTVNWVDGAMTAGEWDDATVYDVSDILGRAKTAQNCGAAYLYVMNTADTLMVALDGIFDAVENDGADLFTMYFEDNNNGAWPAKPDSGEGGLRMIYHTAPSAPWFYYKPMMSDSSPLEYNVQQASNSSFTNGHMQIEWLIPISATATKWQDLQANAGDTVGFWLSAVDYGAQEAYAWWPTSSSIGYGNLNDMGSLVLASPPMVDESAIRIEVPGDSVCENLGIQPSAWVRNVGNATSTFDAAFFVDNGAIYHDSTQVSNLAPGESTLVQFKPWTVPGGAGITYDLMALTMDPNDINAVNDTVKGSTISKACFVPVHDMGATQVIEPPDTVCTDTSYPVTAIVHNYGNQVEDSVMVECLIPPLYPPDTVTLYNVQPAQTDTVNFANWDVPGNPGVGYTVGVTTLLTGDQNSSNNGAQKVSHSKICPGISEAIAPCHPMTFALFQNSPNPVKTSTAITYQIAEPSRVRLSVYDITGRLMTTLVDGENQPGFYTVRWNGMDSSGKAAGNGIYFYKLEAGTFVSTSKLVIVR